MPNTLIIKVVSKWVTAIQNIVKLADICHGCKEIMSQKTTSFFISVPLNGTLVILFC